MNILKLDYQGLPVHANREAWFNATGIPFCIHRKHQRIIAMMALFRYLKIPSQKYSLA